MNNRITVRINDHRVWDPMSTAVHVCMALNQHQHVELFFDNEAPNIRGTELVDFFNTLQQHGIDLKRISVITGNLCESYPQVTVIKDTHAMFELSEFQKVSDQLPKHKNIKYHFGMLVGRCTMPRLVLASHLYANYKEKTFQTFHWQADHDYYRTHFELEALVHEYGPCSPEFDEAVALLQAAPLMQHPVKQYPILHPENLHAACAWYPDFFVDVVCETWYTGNTFFLTEKFWRAVATRTPFIIHGPQWILQRLKQIGFKTFDSWWDEGYSEDPVHHNIVEIKRVLHFLSQRSTTELNHMYDQMQSVLDHNYQVFKTLRYQDFDKLKDYDATR
jgi:hypothetical protein